MAARNFSLPGNRAFNSNGLSVPGATATLYTTGTSTEVAGFFSDSGLSVSLGATITANGAGHFADAYGDNATPYRLIVKDRTGATLDDIDPFYFGQMLIAAGGTSSYATRTALAAVPASSGAVAKLLESGREGDFVFSSSNLSSNVTADTQQGVYVPPASTSTGASGAWVRKFSGRINVKWFGAVGDGVTDDHAAFTAAIAYAGSLSQNTSGNGVPSIFIPIGIYVLGTTTLDITRPVALIGENLRGTKLKWTNGTTGIRIQHGNTTGATGVQASTGYAPRAKIANMMLDGGYSGGAESEAHGVHARTTCDIENLEIANFPGEGIYIRADTGDGAVLGNANKSVVRDVTTSNCRKGVYAYGSDVNACLFDNVQGFSNRQWGFHDRSLIGNKYDAPLAEGNARTSYNTGAANLPACYVTQGGFQYFCLPGQESGASTNAPTGAATSNTYWGYWKSGGVETGIPAWFNGINVRAGGGYFIEGTASTTKLDQPYCENSEIALVDQLVTIVGKEGMSYAYRFTGGLLGGGLGEANGPNVIYTTANGIEVSGNVKINGNPWLASGNSFIGPQSGSGTNAMYLETCNGTNSMYWRSWSGGVATTRVTLASTVTGDFYIVPTGNLNVEISAANRLVVSTSGIAVTGVVTATSSITSSGGGIGYSTGAGGTVTQATSKSTGVTLSKLSGQITMNNASLAAATIVSFVLTNTNIAATDVLILNHVSGGTPGAYTLNAQCAAGSATINVRNNTAGALGEAIVISFAVIKAVTA